MTKNTEAILQYLKNELPSRDMSMVALGDRLSQQTLGKILEEYGYINSPEEMDFICVLVGKPHAAPVIKLIKTEEQKLFNSKKDSCF